MTICNDTDLGKQQCEEKGVLPHLVKLLGSSNKDVQYETLRSLTNISNAEQAKVTLRELEAIPPLVNILGRATVDQYNPETEKVLLHSLWTLTNLATNSQFCVLFCFELCFLVFLFFLTSSSPTSRESDGNHDKRCSALHDGGVAPQEPGHSAPGRLGHRKPLHPR